MSPFSARLKRSCCDRNCDIQNSEETLVEKGEIKKRGRTYCVAGALNDVSYMNDTHTPGVSMHHLQKDVAVWPKWTRLDRCHRGHFALQSRRPYAKSRLRRQLSRTHTMHWSNLGNLDCQ